MGVPWHVSALLASIETLLWAGTERLATQGPFPKDRGAELGRCWQRTSVGAAWRCPGMLALQGCGHANHRTTAPGLTHIAIGNFCRAHAVRDALGAAGRTIPCKDGQMGWVARPPADRRGGEGWRAALTEGAITIAVIGSMAQEGVGDAAGMPCKMGGSLSATGSLPWHPWPGAAQPFGTEQRLRGHGSELTGEDRAEAGTYPVEMLGVPRKPWKGRDRVGETPKPQCSPASPRAVKPEPQDVPVPPTSGFVPMGTVPLGTGGQAGLRGTVGISCRTKGFATASRGQSSQEAPRQTPPCCVPLALAAASSPSPVSRLGESMAARSPFLFCCLPREAAVSSAMLAAGVGGPQHAQGPPPRWGQDGVSGGDRVARPAMPGNSPAALPAGDEQCEDVEGEEDAQAEEHAADIGFRCAEPGQALRESSTPGELPRDPLWSPAPPSPSRPLPGLQVMAGDTVTSSIFCRLC